VPTANRQGTLLVERWARTWRRRCTPVARVDMLEVSQTPSPDLPATCADSTTCNRRMPRPKRTYIRQFTFTRRNYIIYIIDFKFYFDLDKPGHPSVGKCNEYQRKLGRKQAHRAMHCLSPPYPGVSQCELVWLAGWGLRKWRSAPLMYPITRNI